MPYTFFASTLPDQGLYCIALQNPDGGFRQKFFKTKQAAHDYALHQDEKGEIVYYGQAGFKTAANRKGENAGWFRSFWLDIDCGIDDPYKTQTEGIHALQSFCKTAALPLPTVINSGTGLYAYWVLSEDVETKIWLAVAQVLKRLCKAHEFRVDPVRTADRASVLRPVGATNRKNNKERKVNPLALSEALALNDFAKPLLVAASKVKLDIKTLGVPNTQINAEFQLEMTGEKPSAYAIANKCAQIALVRDRKGDVSEPLWYSAIGLLKSTLEAPEIIHEWSPGHPDYTREATDRKIAQHAVHATTCNHFHTISPDLCIGCAYHSKINSPWRLGLPDPKPIELPEDVEDVKLPLGFIRTDRGIVYDDGEGAVINVYPYDILPVSLTQDESLRQEMMSLRAKDPHTGWFNVDVRTALLHDVKTFLMAMADQGVHPYYGKTERALFMQLLAGYMQTLKDNRRKMVLSQQMGWLTEPDGRQAFVLGDRLISDRGVETIGVARGTDAVVKAITTQGELGKWTDTTKILDRPGLEPWAFTLAALGFGSPLMKFTGYKGSMLSMVGKSGLGKTAMGWWSLSVWGNPEKLQMLQRDTQNATTARMALYNNLPLFIDEITNIKQEVLSDLAYQMTQGRDKHSLTRSRSEKSALTWATIGAASSNKSLVDVLGGYKSDASAEINRVFEYEFPSGKGFDGVTAYRMFMSNFGVAGEVYAQYLVEHQDEHADAMRQIQASIEKHASCLPEERFWAVTAACALYGAAIAKKLGLFHVDLDRLRLWIYDAIQSMRGVREDTVTDAAAWIGTFLSKHAANMLVVAPLQNPGMYHPVVAPRGPLYIRKDQSTNILWISRELLKRELLAGSASYSKIKQELIAMRALVSDSKRMALGKGTEWQGTAEQVWEIRMDCPALQNCGVERVKQHWEGSDEHGERSNQANV